MDAKPQRYSYSELAEATRRLLALAESQAATIAAQAQKIEQLTQHVAKLERMLFGPRSEHIEPVRKEVERELNQAEVEEIAERLAAENDRATPNEQDRKKARRIRGRKNSEPDRADKRKSRLQTAPIIEKTIEVTPDDLPAGMTLDDFKPLGSSDTSIRVSHVTGHLLVTRYVLPKLQHKEQPHIIVCGTAPDTTPREGGRYESSVYAKVVTARVLDNMPLNRQSKASAREGYLLAPSVLIGMFHHAAYLLTPIYDRLVKELRAAEYLCADETPQPMQAPGKGKTSVGWMWMALCATAIVYRFDPSRSAEAGRKLLGDNVKNLMVDGYSAYSNAAIDGGRSGCWTHARRGIYELRENWPAGQNILDLIRQIYRVEIETRRTDPNDAALLAARRGRSTLLVDKIYEKIETEIGVLSPASGHAKALAYLLNRQSELRRFLDDPKIPLDNNISERALRTVAQGRKSSLFVGPENNGQDLAILLTVLRTCELHDVNPIAYLNAVLVPLRKLGPRKDRDDDAAPELDALTPVRWKLAQQATRAG